MLRLVVLPGGWAEVREALDRDDIIYTFCVMKYTHPRQQIPCRVICLLRTDHRQKKCVKLIELSSKETIGETVSCRL